MIRLYRSFRAISPVLAVLMMIAVAIAGSLVVYAWIMGYIDLSTGRSGEAIQIQNVFNDGDDLLVYVQNVGEGVVQLEEDDCLYIDGILVPCTISGVTVSDDMATLNQGETATLRYTGGATLPGEKVKIKVTTTQGNFAEDSAYPAGSARAAPVLDHFAFSTIGRTQVSGISFTITLRAMDQYDEPFADYIGVNILTCSVGEISPTATGSFTHGIWTGEVTVTGSATATTITTAAQADLDCNGTSNTFAVLLEEPVVTMWNQTYGGPEDDFAWSVVETSSGGYVIAGESDNRFWLVKTDAFGNEEWNRTYGGNYGTAYSVIETDDRGYAIAGQNSNDFFLVKTDASGNMEWNRTYGDEGQQDVVRSVIQTSDGGYAIAGWTWSHTNPTEFADFWLVKTDELGNEEWNQTYGGTGREAAYSVVEIDDGGYVMAGWTESYGAGGADVWLVKTNVVGNMEWSRTHGGAGDDCAFAMVADSEGYTLAGCTYSIGAGGNDFWLVRTDLSGNLEWNRTYGGPETDDQEIATALVATTDGGYALAGYTDAVAAETYDFWLVKTDSSGAMEWTQTYEAAQAPDTNIDQAQSLVQTSDGGYAIAGGTTFQLEPPDPPEFPFSTREEDFWLVKTDENGNSQDVP